MKNKKYIILSFLIPFFVYFLTFYINGLFSTKTILMGDSILQYYPLFNYLKNITNNTFYCFYKGLSGSMFGTIFYYLSSPLNIFIFLSNNTLNFMTLLIIIKLSLSGITMYKYLSHKFNNSFTTLVFSLLYSFCGYNLNYFLEIMWLDTVILTPLVLLGIDKLIEENKSSYYIIFLFISILANYYTAYMMCIFVVLYFFYEVIIKYKNKDYIKITKKFIIISFLTGMMCSIFLIPCIYEMLSYNRSQKINEIFYLDYNIFNLFAKTYMATIDGSNPFNTNAINIYCGIITIPLVYLYFKNKKIDKLEKKLTFIIILIMILPCFIGIFNFIWHLFTTPYGYYYRYSFLLCLFLILIAYKSFNNLEINNIRIMNYLSIYLSYSLIIIFINYFKNYYNYINYYYIWLTILFLIIYFILLKNKKFKILLILILFENVLNVYLSINKYDFQERKVDTAYIIDKYNLKNRIRNYNYVNDSLYNNYMSTNSFLSTYNSNNYDIQYKLINIDYLENPNNFISVENLSYISDSILGVDSSIYNIENNNYILLATEYVNGEKLYIYKNPTNIGIGYIVKNYCNNIEYKFYDEDAFNCLTDNNTNYYIKANNLIDSNKSYKYNIDTDYFYLYTDYSNINYLNEVFGSNIIRYTDNYLFIKNTYNTIELNFLEDTDLSIYYFDYDLYKEVFDNYNKEILNYEINNNELSGNITTDGGILLITIPYEKGLNVYVDNKLVNYDKVLDTFIGINLESGYHDIKITYKQPYLKLGIFISILSLITLVIYIKKVD
jgi:uncharacterized membrane protein YfhO